MNYLVVFVLFLLSSCVDKTINQKFSSLKGKNIEEIYMILGVPNRVEKTENYTFSTYKKIDCELNIKSNKNNTIEDVTWARNPILTECPALYRNIK